MTNVARASLEELLEDYQDFLRVRNLAVWDKDSRQARYVRKIGGDPQAAFRDYREFCDTRPAEVVANIAICLIHQTNYLLDRQLAALEQDFIREGGLRRAHDPRTTAGARSPERGPGVITTAPTPGILSASVCCGHA